MLAGGRLKTLVFITFNVSAGNRKQQHSVPLHTQNIGMGEGHPHTCVSLFNSLNIRCSRLLHFNLIRLFVCHLYIM